MRLLTYAERKKRGCVYCADADGVTPSGRGGIRVKCPHEECPCEVLDKYETYEDYLKSEEQDKYRCIIGGGLERRPGNAGSNDILPSSAQIRQRWPILNGK